MNLERTSLKTVMKNIKHVHFIAICGTGMGSLAGLMRSRGIYVTGSDLGIYPPMSTALAKWGIPVFQGFSSTNLALDPSPDVVVIGNAVRSDNLEVKAAQDRNLEIYSFPDALYEFAMRDKCRVVVAGTHGKTTTTSMLGTILRESGLEPSIFVGGISNNLGSSFVEGEGEHFVVEGDEYDTAFFDKTPKFLHYHPSVLVITSVEFDHADIYYDLEDIMGSFRTLIERMPSDGLIVAACDHPNVATVTRDAPCKVVPYSVESTEGAGYVAVGLVVEKVGTRFVLECKGARVGEFFLPTFGRYNVENATAALAVSLELGVSVYEVTNALGKYRGVKRRQEIVGEVSGITLVDDFAHHPTAVRETLGGLTSRFPGRRVVAVFEPRSNTSRRTIFQEAYGESFACAGRVIVNEVNRGPLYSATGPVEELFSSTELARTLRDQDIDAIALDGVDSIVDDLICKSQVGDVIVTLSNGNFSGIWEKLLRRLGDA